MKKAIEKLNPQEGTGLNESGEPLGAFMVPSPIVSGGDNNRLKKNARKGRTKKNAKDGAASDSDASSKTVESVKSTESRRLWDEIGPKRRRRDDSMSASDAEDVTTRGSCDPSNVVDASTTSGNRRREFLRNKEETHARVVADLEERVTRANTSRAALGFQSLSGDTRTVNELNHRITEDVGIIIDVAAKSGHLKGTLQRALKDAAGSIKAVFETLHSRNSSDEVIALQADNDRLKGEIAELRREMKELRDAVCNNAHSVPQSVPVAAPRATVVHLSDAPQSGEFNVGDFSRSIMLQVGNMVNARLESLEGRLLPEERLRPPLAADRRSSASVVASHTSRASIGVTREVAPSSKKKGNKKSQPGAGSVASRPPRPAPRTLPPSQTVLPVTPMATDEEWKTVMRRGRKRGKKSAATVKPSKTSKQAPRLRPPRSSAVVITLQPGAEQKGVTYAKLLSQAKEGINLSECGISSSGLRFRKATTGARILEIPGATSGDKADVLASKLREIFGNEAKVSRPTKCAELRVSGLDDSVTAQEVVEAVANRGGCSVEMVKAGELRPDSQGNSTLWMRCPVTAAKKLSEGGRLLVGWVAARVQLLPTRPMKCFRCLQIGHVRAQCKAEVDRSEECYRCGCIGHKAAKCCAAEPHCSVCAEAKRPADHRLGSKKCSPPKFKNRAKPAAPAHRVPSEGEAMITN